MNTIDLTQEIYDGMPVYPGDPEVKVSLVFNFEKHDWNMRRLEINTHDGTHVNVPIHSASSGKNLDDYQLSDFMGKSRVFRSEDDIESGIGLLFVNHDVDMQLAKKIVAKKSKFIGLSEKFDFNLEAERYLLSKGIISYERLANTDQLPVDKLFDFYGVPLKIRDGDGSPVRAFAVIK